MRYSYKCECGAENIVETDIKIGNIIHKCFKCKKKFKYNQEADNDNSSTKKN